MSSAASTFENDVEEVVRDWDLLKGERAHTRTGPASRNRIGTILRFIGLPYEHESDITVQREGPGDRWIHFIFQADPETVRPIRGAPRFCSQANGTYHVFCLWEDARPDRIYETPAIRNLSQGEESAVIVIYLNELTETERHGLRRESWIEGLTIAVLDETLLAFLASSETDRFRRFLEVSLPFTAANPYNPETAGWGARVAKEMFYGRQELAREISALRDGTSLIFGGRQLGKTALLRRVQETTSQPDLRHFAWFIDLKDMGYVQLDSATVDAKEPRDIFEILYNNFQQSGLLGEHATTGSWEQMRQEILDAFDKDLDLQIRAMFDESDAFLQSDAATGSAVVESLRSLMDSTGNRFKVVFAGLHNVQRFAHRANNPFPNLGYNADSPRRGGIGPLGDRDARSLVEQPFSLLGFRFQPLVVDKILSYTNRHPSLIQFFCHELIQSFRRESADRNPPFEIGIEDVDRVYRTQRIQDGIKRRFEETFKLDPRYHVISLTMILYQERPTENWSLEKLRDHCQSCCPLTFDRDNMDDLELRSLLNELIGLGILAEDGDSYRMRSSLIAQMFGSETEIGRALDELEAGDPLSVS